MISLLNVGAFSLSKHSEKENQDSILLPTLFRKGYLFAVADGVGGYVGALAASSLAIQELLFYTANQNDELWSVFYKIKNKMNESFNNTKFYNSATTLSFCYIDEKTIHIGHTGDSRIYIRKKGKLVQLTKDYTLHQELLDEGLYSKKELKKLDEGKNTLTAALSSLREVKFQSLEIPILDYLSEDKTIELYVMSDGAYHYWEHRPRFSINTLKNPTKFASALQRRIEKKGPIDDYSLVAVQLMFSN